MTYFLLQTTAMFLVAYFGGCVFGCLAKTLMGVAREDSEQLGVGGLAPALAQQSPRPADVPAPPAPVIARAPSPPAAPSVAQPAARPAQPASRPAGSGVAAQVTATAAAAAAASATGAMRPPAATVAASVAGDDLKRIKGIGPEIERKLNSLGVRRYSEIAAWSSADVARFNREAGQDGRIQHENWIEQAQILSRGGETAFSRRVDRREVPSGTADHWIPTAPNEVARQAAAAAPRPPQAPPAAPPVMTPGGAVASAAAAAIAAAGAASRTTTAAALTPPSAPSVQTARPAAPPPVAPAGSQSISMRPAPGPGNLRRFVRLAAPEGKPDDLSLIAGVGEKIGADLNRYGVYHYWQLAAMGPEDIDYMEVKLGHKGRMRHEEWPEQARELMAGKPPRARADRERAPHDAGAAAAHTHKHVQPPAQASTAQPVSQPVTSAAPPAPPALPPQTAQVQVAPAASKPPAPPASPLPGQHPHVAAHHHAPATGGGTTSVGAAAAAISASTALSGASQAVAAASTAQAVPPAPSVTPPPAAAMQQTPAAAPAASGPSPVASEIAGSGWMPRSRASNVAARNARDDLKRIKGIGVVIEKKLEAMGITSYTQIAAWGTGDIEKVSNALDFKGRIEREGWVEQARILDGGGQTDFSRRMDRGDVSGGGRP